MHACNVRKLVTESEWTRVGPIKVAIIEYFVTDAQLMKASGYVRLGRVAQIIT